MPLVDRLPEEAPPVVVAVVGPPGVCDLVCDELGEALILSIGRENDIDQILDPPVHKADPQFSPRTVDRRHVEKAASFFPRESIRVPCEHDRCGKDCGHCASHD